MVPKNQVQLKVRIDKALHRRLSIMLAHKGTSLQAEVSGAVEKLVQAFERTEQRKTA